MRSRKLRNLRPLDAREIEKQVNPIIAAHNKGWVINTADVCAKRDPADGRMQLFLSEKLKKKLGL